MEEHMNKDLPYSRWQGSYRDALIELDLEKLNERVQEAERAIHDRLQTLPRSHESFLELQAIADALANLRCLKRETRDYSDCSQLAH